jgi:hypothetical protein
MVGVLSSASSLLPDFDEEIVGEGEDLWVILLSSSKYYFNYRHFANCLTIYHIVRSLGVSDDHIILMDAADVLNDERNLYKGEIFYENPLFWPKEGKRNLLNFTRNYRKERYFSEEVNDSTSFSTLPLLQNEYEVDYRGSEVTISLFVDLLSSKLPLTSSSKLLFYLTGHGGNEFFKFSDFEEMNLSYFISIFQSLYYERKYSEILLILDTCQASTMVVPLLEKIPSLTVLASSLKDENSYSYYPHPELAVPLIDRFTFSFYNYFYVNYLYYLEENHERDRRKKEGKDHQSSSSLFPESSYSLTIDDLFHSLDLQHISSTSYLGISKKMKFKKEKFNIDEKADKQLYLLNFFSNKRYLKSFQKSGLLLLASFDVSSSSSSPSILLPLSDILLPVKFSQDLETTEGSKPYKPFRFSVFSRRPPKHEPILIFPTCDLVKNHSSMERNNLNDIRLIIFLCTFIMFCYLYIRLFS